MGCLLRVAAGRRSPRLYLGVERAGARSTWSARSGARVPTALERAGNFTASATKPTDPATNGPFVCNGVTHVICPNRLDPVAKKIIDTYIPTSNVTLSTGNAGWQGNIPTPYNFDEYLSKVDYQLNDAHRLSVSYFNTGGTSTTKAGPQCALEPPGFHVAAA